MIDYLRDYPFGPAPDTWALNDVFINVIREKEALWEHHDLAWVMGIEREFLWLTPAEFSEFLTNNYQTTDEAKLIEIDPQFAVSFNMMRALKDDDEYKQAYLELEHICGQKIAANIHNARTSQQMSRAQREEAIFGRIQESWRYSSQSRRDLALAFLHLFPESEGGVNDLIEYRFGPERFGKGWYDCGHIVELRTPPIEGMIKSIEQYHKMLWGIKNASERFGLIPVLTGGPVEPHVHFSFKVNDRDQQAMTTFETPESEGLMLRALKGYTELLESTPAFLTDDIPDELVNDKYVKILPSRASSLRVCEDNLEVRIDISHLARNMAFLIAGCSAYAFDPKAAAKSEREITMADYIIPSDDFTSSYPHLSATLQNCRIGEDGYLVADPGTLHISINAMQKEMGINAQDIIIPMPGYEENSMTLAQWESWKYTLGLVKLAEGQLDVSSMPASPLTGFLTKTGAVSTVRRPFLKGNEIHSHLLSDTLEDEENREILARAMGEEASGQLLDFYKEEDSKRRTQTALDEITALLEAEEDLDSPSPDLAEKIYIILCSSLLKIIDNKVSEDSIFNANLLHKMTAQRLSTMALEAKRFRGSQDGRISNSQTNLLMDFVAETEKPFEDLSRYSKMIAHSTLDALEELLESDSSLTGAPPHIMKILMWPHYFFAFTIEEKDQKKILEQTEKTLRTAFENMASKIPECQQHYWEACSAAALESMTQIRKNLDNDIIEPLAL